MDFFTSDRRAFSRQVRLGGASRTRKDYSLYVWTAVIVILSALTSFSWIFCLYVFGHPEKAFSYNMLMKLEKLNPLIDYAPAGAPRGRFNSAKDLYKSYAAYSPAELRQLSSVLRRQYVLNFDAINDVAYAQGSYKVVSARPLMSKDVFPHGLVIRAVAEDYPNVLLEYVLPVKEGEELPAQHYDPVVNNVLQIGTSATCAAIINVAKVDEDRLCFTAISITYGKHETPARTVIATQPPDRLNLYGALPITADPPAANAVAEVNPAPN